MDPMGYIFPTNHMTVSQEESGQIITSTLSTPLKTPSIQNRDLGWQFDRQYVV